MTRQNSVIHNKGFSLIELLVALVIIMVSMLAFATMMTLSMRTNLQNDLRDTATKVANQTGEVLVGLPFTDPLLNPGGPYIRSSSDNAQNGAGFPYPVQMVRGKNYTFDISWTITKLTDASLQITTAVTGTYRNVGYTRNAIVFKQAKL